MKNNTAGVLVEGRSWGYASKNLGDVPRQGAHKNKSLAVKARL